MNGQATEQELEAVCVEAKAAREAAGQLKGEPDHDAAVNAASSAYGAVLGHMSALYPTARAVTNEAAREATWDDDEDRYRLEWSEALESVWYSVYHLYVAKLANLVQGK